MKNCEMGSHVNKGGDSGTCAWSVEKRTKRKKRYAITSEEKYKKESAERA